MSSNDQSLLTQQRDTIQLWDTEIDQLRSVKGGPIRKAVWMFMGMPEHLHACSHGWMDMLRGKVIERIRYEQAVKIAHLPKLKRVEKGECVWQTSLL